ncbi:hypothetical protein RFI_22568 [Reticulomyxa filosa]|uniref:Uncharacterized protein n=1 Tax=Reticulomyxa filosa TaxID=46433 RepID=X6MMY8_RETFI|nr:hypothetical protein RFI_22568 [Reticulomyxa filosa]|eukprot:ETO14797.1 hypothetical protein RFI_22568 [Reticulomyxa filosa]
MDSKPINDIVVDENKEKEAKMQIDRNNSEENDHIVTISDIIEHEVPSKQWELPKTERIDKTTCTHLFDKVDKEFYDQWFQMQMRQMDFMETCLQIFEDFSAYRLQIDVWSYQLQVLNYETEYAMKGLKELFDRVEAKIDQCNNLTLNHCFDNNKGSLL